jgi:hypothetical protein
MTEEGGTHPVEEAEVGHFFGEAAIAGRGRRFLRI